MAPLKNLNWQWRKPTGTDDVPGLEETDMPPPATVCFSTFGNAQQSKGVVGAGCTLAEANDDSAPASADAQDGASSSVETCPARGDMRLPMPCVCAPAGLADAGRISPAFIYELSRPLAAAMNYLNAARRLLGHAAPGSPSLASEYLEQTGEQIAQAGYVARYAWHRTSQEEKAHRRARCLGSAVEEAVAAVPLGTLHPEQHVRVDIAPEARLVPVLHAQFQQVLLRLVQDAAVLTRGQSPCEILIAVHAGPQQDQIEVAVSVPAADRRTGSVAFRFAMPAMPAVTAEL